MKYAVQKQLPRIKVVVWVLQYALTRTLIFGSDGPSEVWRGVDEELFRDADGFVLVGNEDIDHVVYFEAPMPVVSAAI